jgi:hypothetical protein
MSEEDESTEVHATVEVPINPSPAHPDKHGWKISFEQRQMWFKAGMVVIWGLLILLILWTICVRMGW